LGVWEGLCVERGVGNSCGGEWVREGVGGLILSLEGEFNDCGWGCLWLVWSMMGGISKIWFWGEFYPPLLPLYVCYPIFPTTTTTFSHILFLFIFGYRFTLPTLFVVYMIVFCLCCFCFVVRWKMYPLLSLFFLFFPSSFIFLFF